MSFFDEDDEPRTRTQQTPRRAAPPHAAGADNQTLLVRRAVALGGGVLLLILLVIAVRGCLETRSDNALKDYNTEVSSIAVESEDQVAKPFFDLLSRPGSESATDLQTAVSGYREQAETQLAQAKRIDTPGDMTGAQEAVLTALEMRRDGLDVIAREIRTALGEGDTAEDGVRAVAGQMQVFLASDVLWDTRVIPFIKNALDEAEIGGQRIEDSNFLPNDLGWLSVETVADRLGQDVSTGANRSGTPAPGTHGHGLVSVSVGDVTLQPAPTANRIPARPAPVFTVAFENQGENDEFEVKVVVRITGSGQPIRVERTVDTVAQGATAEATLALPRSPPVGEPLTINVEVRPVPGEEKTDNNKQEYPVLFTGGA